MRLTVAFAAMVAFFSISSAEAQVHVRGYTRSDGVYVRPHIRSSPNGSLADNYGSSRSSPLYSPSLPDLSFVTPMSRDHDRDGIANMYDYDDDNDAVADSVDPTQYGAVGRASSTSPSTDRQMAQYNQTMRAHLVEMHNSYLRSAQSDGVIADFERSHLDFLRRASELYR